MLHELYLGERPVRYVSYENVDLLGQWNFSEGAAGEPNVFEVVFNTNPEREWRVHRFVQIRETNVYRHRDDHPGWHIFLVHLPNESWRGPGCSASE